MISHRERFGRVTGLEAEGRHPDYSRERTLFYFELVQLTSGRRHSRCRSCRECLQFDASACENCECWVSRMLSGPTNDRETD